VKAADYTVKRVAAISGVSVRTLHFYDETGLLKPARIGVNGYRYYEEAQLLTLQQILFYRELGFELKEIKKIIGRAKFEKAAALKSHRAVLEKNLARTRELIETVDKTIDHLKGKKKMKTEEMFAGFRVDAGAARFGEKVTLGGEPNDCKVSARDTNGALAIFEFHGSGGGPRHLHYEQDEWIYVLEGDLELEIGGKRHRLGAGESVFIPRKTAHTWAAKNGRMARIINVYEPGGRMEEFFRAVGEPFKDLPTLEQLVTKTYTQEQVKSMHRLFDSFGMDLVGPPLGFE
jgi:DNA-binding transcriptional MerR regulator